MSFRMSALLAKCHMMFFGVVLVPVTILQQILGNVKNNMAPHICTPRPSPWVSVKESAERTMPACQEEEVFLGGGCTGIV